MKDKFSAFFTCFLMILTLSVRGADPVVPATVDIRLSEHGVTYFWMAEGKVLSTVAMNWEKPADRIYMQDDKGNQFDVTQVESLDMTDIPYQVIYENIFDNVDLIVYPAQYLHAGQLNVTYEFVVYPMGNPADIRVAYTGSGDMHHMRDGMDAMVHGMGTLNISHPYVYQHDTFGGKAEIQNEYGYTGNIFHFDRAHSYEQGALLMVQLKHEAISQQSRQVPSLHPELKLSSSIQE